MPRNPATWEGIDLCDGRYCSLKKLGEGGMGYVYKARDKRMGRFVVIKVPRAEMLVDSQFRKRFVRELQSLVKLEHRHIVAIQDYNQEDKIPYAVMQYLPQGDLDDRRSQDPQDLKKWLKDIASALDFVHKKGYVHRDVKPGNILFDDEGYAYLSDFGIAKVVADSEEDQQGLTKMGFVIGTPDYMAPELHSNKFDGRIDQYALAVTVYELLSGGTPYRGTTPVEIMFAHKTEQAARIPNISAEFNDAILKGMAKDPDQRYANCDKFAKAVLVAIDNKVQSPRQTEPTAIPIIKNVDQSKTRVESPRRSTQVRSSDSATGRQQLQQDRKLRNKRKERIIWIAAATGFVLLTLIVLILVSGGVGRESDETAQNETDTNNPAVAAEQTEEEGKANETQPATQEADQEQQRVAREAADREEAEKKRKTAAEAAQREQERRVNEDAKREAARKEQERREKQRIQRAIEDLQQKVKQIIDEADRLKYRPDQALKVLRECLIAVDNAQVPPQLKRDYKERLQSVAADIQHRAANQKAKQKKEGEEKWRREHPEEYLQSLGLEKEKNGWHIQAELKLNALNKPLAKLITEYKRKTRDLKTKENSIKRQETKIDTDMKKLPGRFKSPEFRKWILGGMQDFPDAPEPARRLVDKEREQFDRFREKLPDVANKLEQKVQQLQSGKNQLQGDREAIEEIVDKIANRDEQARSLLWSIEKTEEQLAKEKRNIDSSLQSSGLGFQEPNTTNVENLLKKANEILDDDLIESLPDRRPDRR